MPDAPEEIIAMAERRAQARAAKEFAEADAIRERIASAGWTVEDAPGGGYTLSPAEPPADERLAPGDVPSVLGEPAIADVSLQWVCEGWPEDIDRAIASFRANAAGHEQQFVVADVTGEPADRWGEGVEVVRLRDGTGWAAARNAGLRRARGRLVFVLDGSIEATGDVLGPIARTLADRSVGVCGPFGIVTTDLREFAPSPEPGPCDAVEGYLMAFRRELLEEAGPFDEKFTWYRTADIEWSFRVKDAGYRCEVVGAPVRKHEHRMWFETPPEERARWSKRNFYRFLDRWRDRWDLVLSGEPARD